MSVRRRRLWLRAGIVMLVLAGSAFALRHYRRGQTAVDIPTAKARQGDFLVMVRCRGELTAKRSVQLTAPLDVADLQIVWLAPAGSAVKTGETVIRFDPSRTQQELKEKTAAQRGAQAALDQAAAQSKITAEQDKLDQATASYQVERAKLEASKQSIVSAIQGQESAIDLSLAREKLKVQQAGTTLHGKSDEAKLASLTRLRDEARSQVALTEHRLTLMELKSPLDGVITYLPNTTQGWMNAQPFKVGDHAFAGGALAEIPDLKTLQMESKVEEVDRGRIAVGDSALVHVDAFPEKVLAAKISTITPLTEQSFNEWPPTRSFRAFALIESPDPRMRPGMNAGADLIESKIPNAVSIPAKALFAVAGSPTVYVRSQDKFVAARVRVKARNPDEIAVDGIAPGSVVALAEPAPEKP